MTRIEPGLQFFGNSVDLSMQVADLIAYLAEVERFLKRSATRMAGKYDDLGIDKAYLYEEPLPSILYSSVITATIALLERDLKGFANSLREAENLPLQLRDLSGSWLDRFLTYAEKVAYLNLGVPPQLIEDIRGAVDMRNCLVHAGGYLPDCQSRRPVEAFVKRTGLSATVVEDVLCADSSVARTVIDAVHDFLTTCYDAALRKYPRP